MKKERLRAFADSLDTFVYANVVCTKQIFRQLKLGVLILILPFARIYRVCQWIGRFLSGNKMLKVLDIMLQLHL
jgi:hypothetical protein